MNRRLVLTAFAGALTVAVAATTLQFGGVGRDPARFDRAALIDKLVHCVNLHIADNTSTSSPQPGLVGAEATAYTARLECAFKAIPSPMSVDQVRSLLDTLTEAGRDDAAARSACHDLAHDVGTKAWKSMGARSLTVGLDSCGYGYYHGAMRESLIGNVDPDAGVDRLLGFCGEQLAQYRIGDRRQFIAWNLCAHGVGHALGGAGTELGLGIDLCAPVRTELVDDGDVVCVTGLLNELSAGGWGLEITTSEQALQRCAPVADRYKQVCSSYGHFYANIPLEKLVQRCNTLQPAYVEGCWEAVALSATHEVLFTGGDSEGARLLERPADMAAYVENLCAAETGYSCFSRFFTELSELALNPPKLLEVCSALTDRRRSMACTKAMQEMAAFHTI